MSRRDGIDLLKLYTKSDNVSWNAMLTRCVDNKDINTLAKIRRELQIGMANIAAKKLNNEDINVWYLRLLKSIEKTARQIIRIRHPLPGDNPLLAKNYGPDWLEVKRKRDKELMQFMSRSSY